MYQNCNEAIQWNSTQQWKGHKLLINAMKWMTLKSIMLSDRRQTQKAMYYMISFRCYSERGKAKDKKLNQWAKVERQKVNFKGPQGNFLR